MTDSTRSETTLMEVVSIVLDTPSLSRYAYTGIAQTGGSSTRRRIVVDPLTSRWRSENTDGAVVWDYTPGSRVLSGPDGAHELEVATRPRIPELAARLAFPLALDVWGRSGDGFRPVRVEDVHAGIATVLLRHVDDPAQFGSLSLDLDQRRVTGLTTPTQVLRMQDVVRHPAEF